MPERRDLSAAWIDGAEISADIFGDVATTNCPYDDPELAGAWREGTQTVRDWDGHADLTANPYDN